MNRTNIKSHSVAGWLRVPLLLLLFLLQSCSVGRLFHEEMKREEAMVMLSDRKVYAGKALLPDYKDRHVRFVTEEGKRLRLNAADVEQLRFSKNGLLAGMFVYTPYVSRGGDRMDAAWMKCCGQGKHLKLALLGENWHYNRKGELEAVTFSDGDLYIIGIKADGTAGYVACAGHSRNMLIRAMCKFLADDPDLCGRIASKEVDVFDFTDICNRYAPKENPDGTYQVSLPDVYQDQEHGMKGGRI